MAKTGEFIVCGYRKSKRLDHFDFYDTAGKRTMVINSIWMIINTNEDHPKPFVIKHGSKWEIREQYSATQAILSKINDADAIEMAKFMKMLDLTKVPLYEINRVLVSTNVIAANILSGIVTKHNLSIIG